MPLKGKKKEFKLDLFYGFVKGTWEWHEMKIIGM